MKTTLLIHSGLMACLSATIFAAELHVAVGNGNDANNGSAAMPFKSIMAAANQAMPGDTITVHAGIYREEVVPPRGGTSDAMRIIYQAAKGEKVVITGSDKLQGWEKVADNTWKLAIPNGSIGTFNPYAEKVSGDWFNGQGRIHRRGNVYLNGEWLPEALNREAVNGAGAPAWCSVVDGLVEQASEDYLMNIASFKVGSGAAIPASQDAKRNGPRNAVSSEGGQCIGFIANGAWISYEKVNFGTGAENITLRASVHPGRGGVVEVRDGHFDGPLLGKCNITPTGGWDKWQDFTAPITKTRGEKTVFFVFKSAAETAKPEVAKIAEGERKTTLFVRLPAGVDPNKDDVEVCMRASVFTPEKTGVNFLTVRGFKLCNAATNWAAPTMGQRGLVTAYWNKGWIIENNEICYSRCGGVVLGKYSDKFDGQRGTTEGYYDTIKDAVRDGWSKQNIGSHIVRNNHIHHCGQVGIVGSLGCAFSQVIGNDVHDCNIQGIWTGAEMAGIKFHGFIDGVIADNHIWRNGDVSAVWLDWMAQGTRVTGNLLHDNMGHYGDLFTEVDHGPILVANNLFLSHCTLVASAHGFAGIHNLAIGSFNVHADGRCTPFMKPHETDQLGQPSFPVGDARWYNNILAGKANLSGYNQSGADWPCFMGGNVFAKGGTPSKFDLDVVKAPSFDLGTRLVKKDDGWYLTLATDKAWGAAKRKLVTTELLGKAKVPAQGYTLPSGAPMTVDADYFNKKRDAGNPFPGPFETPVNGEVKVWPK